jgi:large subunit ribosomal protein L15
VNLTDISKGPKGPRKYKFVKGRGHSSGVGKTCGRGRKGQYARQGTSFRPYFEGGQMPMLRRLPKFGFNNSVFKTDWEVVNVGQLEKAYAAGEAVDEASLRAKGLLRRESDGVKVLGGGTLTKKLAVKIHAATKQAEAKILKAGGTLERLIAPRPPKKKPEAAKKGEAPPKPAVGKKPEGPPKAEGAKEEPKK